jgi:hypothetical protein
MKLRIIGFLQLRVDLMQDLLETEQHSIYALPKHHGSH